MFLNVWPILLIALAPYVANCSDSNPKVRVPTGTYIGKMLTSFSGDKYAAYRGIPYALPPIGKRRFAKPEASPKIKGVINATEFGPSCVQIVGLSDRGQEDCLYLNVYTPLTQESRAKKGGALKKVFVWIHGGAFMLGSSRLYYPGDLVTRADIIVVTINYRLGWLGFMRGNSDALPGNQAFWDQLLALQWVKDNIRGFGGDPDDVTLSGESAGSFSVAVLSISPLAKNLFSKALLLSGVPVAFQAPSHKSNDLIKTAAPEFGCDVYPDNEDIDKMISCLRGLPTEAFPNKRFSATLMFRFISSGDEMLPRPITELMNDTNYLSKIGFFSRNYLLSVTKQDGYVLVNSIFGKMNLSSTDSIAHALTPIFKGIPEPVIKSLVSEYLKIYGDLEKSAIAIITDSFYIQPHTEYVKMFERYHERHQEAPSSNRAYMLSLDHSPTFMPNSYMAHGLDLVFIFDLVPSLFLSDFYPGKIGNFTEEDWKMKYALIDLIKIFMDTGTPGEKFSRQLSNEDFTRPYISFSLQPSVGQDILGDRRKIWKEQLPNWLEKFRKEEENSRNCGHCIQGRVPISVSVFFFLFSVIFFAEKSLNI